MTTNPTFCPLLALFVQTPLCLRRSLLDRDSVSCAWPVTIPLEAVFTKCCEFFLKTYPVLPHFEFMPISACTSRFGRSRGSSRASDLEGASLCIRRLNRAGAFLVERISSVKWTGVQPVALRLLVSSSLLHSKSSISSATLSFSS